MATNEKCTLESVQWIDVNDPSLAEMDELSKKFQLNEHTVRDCLQPEHLPKFEYDEDNHVSFLILRFYTHEVEKDASSIQDLTNKIAIFFTDKTVITIHKTATPFLDVIARRMSGKSGTAKALLTRIIWQALETFDDPANRLSEQLDFYESQVLLKKTAADVTEALFHIKRQAAIGHKVLMLMLEPINHIRVDTAEEALLQDVRDQHLKIQTLYGQVLEDVNNLLTLSTSFAAQRTNEVVRVLTLFSVFFMPLTFIVGIYGMNFEFMPELKSRWGYPIVLCVMAAISLTIYQWFKRKKWL